MRINYNKEKAILEQQQRDIEVPLKNKKIKIYNAALTVITLIIVSCIWIGWFQLIDPTFCEDNLWLRMLLPSIITVICFIIAVSLSKNTISDCEKYSANTKYYLLTNGKTILDHYFRYAHNGEYALWVVLEDSNHNVTYESLWPYFFRLETKTNLPEIIVDLEDCIIYQPYKSTLPTFPHY